MIIFNYFDIGLHSKKIDIKLSKKWDSLGDWLDKGRGCQEIDQALPHFKFSQSEFIKLTMLLFCALNNLIFPCTNPVKPATCGAQMLQNVSNIHVTQSEIDQALPHFKISQSEFRNLTMLLFCVLNNLTFPCVNPVRPATYGAQML